MKNHITSLVLRLNTKNIAVSLFLLAGLSTSTFAQLDFYHSNEIAVWDNGQSLQLPWAGGLNNPQFSNIDLDGDGNQDLFIFDRTNGKILALKHDTEANNTNFSLDFSYDTAFPEVQNWALLRDYNCDGKMDLFTYRSGGIKLYENTSTSTSPSFTLRNGFIFADAELGGGPINFGIYVSAVDIPGIEDIDNDGDLDIITFTQSGTTIQLYLNQSVEHFGDCDSLDFVLANNCYGMFSESIISEDIFIGDEATCPFNVVNPIRDNRFHSGSSICIADTDQNGYMDLIIGDISALGVTLVSLGGSSTSLDSAFATTANYPDLPTTIHTEFFPTAYYADVNNDGIKDLLASPSNRNESEDIHGSYYFKNNGANDLLLPEFQQNDFLIDQMIDLGTGAYPHSVDYNGDGLLDLVVSNKGYYQIGGDYISKLALFENIGSADTPTFSKEEDDYLGLSNLNLGRYLFPTFGDVDGDNDIDMILGTEDGKLYFFENAAPVGQPLDYSNGFIPLTDGNGDPIDVGSNSAPQLFDIDQDGFLDLIVGERNGNINLYSHDGSANGNYSLTNDSLGNISIDLNGDFIGYGIPYAYTFEGHTELMIGTQEGNILRYDNIDGNLEGDFNLVSEHVVNAHTNDRSAPMIADYNNDNKLDLFVGNYSGGIDLWMGGTNVGIEEYTSAPDLISIFPNPADQQIVLRTHHYNDPITIQVLDGLGRMVANTTSQYRQDVTIDCRQWRAGLYYVVAYQNGMYSTKKLAVNHYE